MNLGDYFCQHVLCPDSKGEAILGLIHISLSTLKLFVSWCYVFACHGTKSWAVPGKILQLFLTLYSFLEKDSCFPFCSQRYGCLTINFWNETPSLPLWSSVNAQCHCYDWGVSFLGRGPEIQPQPPALWSNAVTATGTSDRLLSSGLDVLGGVCKYIVKFNDPGSAESLSLCCFSQVKVD